MQSEEPPQNVVSDLEEILEGRKKSSVFDFIYHDARRVGSFLSQFEAYGLPQQIKSTESVGQFQTTKYQASADGGVPLVLKGSGGFDVSASDDIKDSAEHIFDPLWINARRLLDYLAERNLIAPDIWKARLGQFVLCKGVLVVFDGTMMKELWDKDFMKELIRTGAKTNGGEANQADVDGLIGLLPHIPHVTQAHLAGNDYTVWASFSEGSLVGQTSDISLKHGCYIPGDWQMLGIVDAFPDTPIVHEDGTVGLGPDQVVYENAGSPIATALAGFAPALRQLAGRPRGFFGMTPLLIFREVTGAP